MRTGHLDGGRPRRQPSGSRPIFSPRVAAEILGTDSEAIQALMYAGRAGEASAGTVSEGFLSQGELDALLGMQRSATRSSEERERRLAASDRSKSDLLRLASHELRSPIAVIRGYLSLIEEGSLGEIPANLRDILAIIGSRVTVMNSVVELMVEDERLEDASLVLAEGLVDLDQLVQESAQMIATQGQNGRSIRVSSPAEPVLVRGDRFRLLLIVNNLLDNAVKYSPPGEPVTCTVKTTADSASIEVADHGRGIQPDDFPRLFNRFDRLDGGRWNAPAGLGLGLYISRELARLHSGDIAVASVPGAGSTFTLTLPLVEGDRRSILT
jgi:signal transduction histidine kinase